MSQVSQSQPFPTPSVQVTRLTPTPWMRRVAIYTALSLVFFLLGYVSLWGNSHENANRLSEAQDDLRLAQMQNLLGYAVIHAQRSDFDAALLSVSSFYTSLRAEVDGGEASAFSLAQQEATTQMLTGRDDIITLLARRDPAAAARLSGLYRTYSQILAGRTARGVEAGLMDARRLTRAEQTP